MSSELPSYATRESFCCTAQPRRGQPHCTCGPKWGLLLMFSCSHFSRTLRETRTKDPRDRSRIGSRNALENLENEKKISNAPTRQLKKHGLLFLFSFFTRKILVARRTTVWNEEHHLWLMASPKIVGFRVPEAANTERASGKRYGKKHSFE